MNDDELNEMLNQWDAPSAPPTLRQKVRAGFRERVSRAIPVVPRPRFPRVRFAFGLAAATVTLLAATAAFPQVARISWSKPVPYSVDSEFVTFRGDREPHPFLMLTSYSDKGKEIVLTWSMPDHPFVAPVHRFLGQLISFVHGSPRETEDVTATVGCDHACFDMVSEPIGPAAQLLGNGCVTGTVVGHETILGHAAVGVQRPLQSGGRGTFWLAPDLGCHSLRTSLEWPTKDGQYRLSAEKRALRINPGEGRH